MTGVATRDVARPEILNTSFFKIKEAIMTTELNATLHELQERLQQLQEYL
jgi:hypothetical protein